MAKIKTAFICQNCGTSHLKWQGQCTGCNEWGTLVEEIISGATAKNSSPVAMNTQSKPLPLTEIETTTESRIPTKDEEFNRVLGGGIVDGSVVLIGGEPGIGKSTLLLQLALQLGDKKIL
ncbi:MAG: AAA family ATPase, partial [Bacteroidota bacterium]